jgi:hypothetical protein
MTKKDEIICYVPTASVTDGNAKGASQENSLVKTVSNIAKNEDIKIFIIQ